MNEIKYKYNPFSVIILNLILFGSQIGLILLSYKVNEIGAYLFTLFFMIIVSLVSCISIPVLIDFIKGREAIILSNETIIFNAINLHIRYEDIQRSYMDYNGSNKFLKIKLNDFETYHSLLRKSLRGKIILIIFRVMGKSLVFFNLRLVKVNEIELLGNIKKYVNKK